MPDSQKLSSFDPTKVKPKVLIISCTADISYVDHLKDQYFKDTPSPQRASDYMEFLHPGAFPVDDSLDAIAEVIARFSIPQLAIISHIDCGLVDALARKTQPDQADPFLFAGYAQAVIDMFEELKIDADTIGSLNVGQVTVLLSKLVTRRIAKHLYQRSELALNQLQNETVTDSLNASRLVELKNLGVSAYSFLGPKKGLEQTIERFSLSNYESSTSITPQGHS